MEDHMEYKIRPCTDHDFETIHEIINSAARVYKGVIPDDCWEEPYMPKTELREEIGAGVRFWGYWHENELAGVMGTQDVGDVTLIRHSYVKKKWQGRGIGGRLLEHLRGLTSRPVLIGTWADAVWAIRFYEKHGFFRVGIEEKNALLEKYWTISKRQIETSVVLKES